jgi:trigger factor
MQVTETNAEGLKRAYKVVIPAQDIEAQITTRLQEVGRSVNVPGFRPGKVPLGILKSRFGPSVMGEVMEQAVSESTGQTIQDNKLRPAVQPRVEIVSYEEGGDLEYTIEVETLPEIELMNFAELKLERLDAEVDDAAVETELVALSERFKQLSDVDESHEAEEGDVAIVDFEGRIDGTPFEGGTAEGYHLALGAGMFIPGFEDQLLGAKAGDDREVKVTFPEEYGNKNLSGKEAVFAVKVKEVKGQVAAAIDDELAQRFGEEDLDSLKVAMRGRIEGEYKSLGRSVLKRKMFDVIAEKHDFPLPESMVEQEFGQIWERVEAAKGAGELDDEDAAKDEDVLKAEYRTIAERRVRVGLLLSEVGGQNNIVATPEEVNRAMMEEVRRYPGQEQRMLELYSSNPSFADSLRAPIIEDKVVDFIAELAEITGRTVSIEELMKPENGDEKPAAKKKPAPKKKAATKAKGTEKATKVKKAKVDAEEPATASVEGDVEAKEG